MYTFNSSLFSFFCVKVFLGRFHAQISAYILHLLVNKTHFLCSVKVHCKGKESLITIQYANNSRQNDQLDFSMKRSQ